MIANKLWIFVAVVLAACAGEIITSEPLSTTHGSLGVRIEPLSSRAEVSLVRLTLTPSGLTQDLTYVASDGSYAGLVTDIAPGAYNVAIVAYDGAVSLASAATDVVVMPGAASAVELQLLEFSAQSTSPYQVQITAVTIGNLFPDIHESVALTVHGYSPDGQTSFNYVWSDNCPNSAFGSPSARSTNWSATTYGTCVVNVQLSNGSTTDTESFSIFVTSDSTALAPGWITVTGTFVPAPYDFALGITASGGDIFESRMVGRRYPAWPSLGYQYPVSLPSGYPVLCGVGPSYDGSPLACQHVVYYPGFTGIQGDVKLGTGSFNDSDYTATLTSNCLDQPIGPSYKYIYVAPDGTNILKSGNYITSFSPLNLVIHSPTVCNFTMSISSATGVVSQTLTAVMVDVPFSEDSYQTDFCYEGTTTRPVIDPDAGDIVLTEYNYRSGDVSSLEFAVKSTVDMNNVSLRANVAGYGWVIIPLTRSAWACQPFEAGDIATYAYVLDRDVRLGLGTPGLALHSTTNISSTIYVEVNGAVIDTIPVFEPASGNANQLDSDFVTSTGNDSVANWCASSSTYIGYLPSLGGVLSGSPGTLVGHDCP